MKLKFIFNQAILLEVVKDLPPRLTGQRAHNPVRKRAQQEISTHTATEGTDVK